MCGIAGVKRMGENSSPITIWTIEQLLLNCQRRGSHATGVAIQYSDGSVDVVKGPEIAWKFVKGGTWKEFLAKHTQGDMLFKDDVMTVLCHARAATQGDPWKNENNHPIFDGKTAVTHNGSVRNDEMLFNSMKLKRIASVDSDIIRAILDEHGLTKKGVEKLNLMNGPAAIAAISPQYPGKLLLTRSGSPLVLAELEKDNWLLWCSVKEGIHNVSREWKQRWGFPFKTNRADLRFNPVELEAAFLVGEGGVEWRERFASNNGASHNLVYRCHDTHADKVKAATERKSKEMAEVYKGVVKDAPTIPGTAITETKKLLPDLIDCPNKECNVVCQLSTMDRGRPLWALICPNCKTNLGTKEDA